LRPEFLIFEDEFEEEHFLPNPGHRKNPAFLAFARDPLSKKIFQRI